MNTHEVPSSLPALFPCSPRTELHVAWRPCGLREGRRITRAGLFAGKLPAQWDGLCKGIMREMIKGVPDAFLWLLYTCLHTGVHVTFTPDPTYMHSSPPTHMHGNTPNTLTSVHTLVQVYNSTKHCIRWLVLGFLLLCLASLKRLIGILPGNEETRIGCYTLGRTYHSFYLHVSSSAPNGQITIQVSLVPNPILWMH